MGTAHYLREEFLYRPLPLHISSVGPFSGVADSINMVGSAGAGTTGWPTNDMANYVPLTMPLPFIVARFFVINGSNITGNVDVGLYSFVGTLLISTGSTARANASAIQYIGVADQKFLAGRYYLALVGSSTTGTYARSSYTSAARARTSGVMEETLGATTLPSTMTPVTFTGTSIFHFGFSQSDSL